MKPRLHQIFANLAVAASLATIANAQSASALPYPTYDSAPAPWLITIDGDLVGDGSGGAVELLFAKNPRASLLDINDADWFRVIFDTGFATDDEVARRTALILDGVRCGQTSVLVPADRISRFSWNGEWWTHSDRNCGWPVSSCVSVYQMPAPGCFIDFDYYNDPELEDRFNKEAACGYGGPITVWVQLPGELVRFDYQPSLDDTDHSVREHFLRQMWTALHPYGVEVYYAGNTGLYVVGAEFVVSSSYLCNVQISPMVAVPCF